jgi:hypothetical protein
MTSPKTKTVTVSGGTTVTEELPASDLSTYSVQSFRVRVSCEDADVRQIEFDELRQNGQPVPNSIKVERAAAQAVRVSQEGFVAKQMCCACGGGQKKTPNGSGNGLDTSKWTADFARSDKSLIDGGVMFTPKHDNVHVNTLHGSLQLTAHKNKDRECTPDSPVEQFETETETTGETGNRRRLVTAPRGQPSVDATAEPNAHPYYVQLRPRSM